ncbi:MAG TPA: DMT family transporter [Actinomycetota bacterium]|nr:DMT family transporter [Actinomycetota bacterium]
MNAGIPLGLSSGLCWGAADFFGGIQSRRLPALTVAFWSQVAGALALAAALAISAVRPAGPEVAWGLAAGVGSGCALVLFYRSLAEGTMSVAAPISACGAIVPVAAALLTGNQPGTLAALGVLTAITGVILVSRPHPSPPTPAAVPAALANVESSGTAVDPVTPARAGRVVAMALGSALGFGLFYVFVDAGTAAAAGPGPGGSRSSPLWVIAGARMSSLAILSTIALFSRRSALRWPGRRLGAVALVGIGDTGANLLFAYAATTGNLAVVGVLGSLYPVATVVLARWLLGERLSGGQNAGVVLALTGVSLLAAA